MANRHASSDLQERRDLLDGRAFLRMQTNNMPLWLIATVANVSEAEVLRLITLAKSAGFRV